MVSEIRAQTLVACDFRDYARRPIRCVGACVCQGQKSKQRSSCSSSTPAISPWYSSCLIRTTRLVSLLAGQGGRARAQAEGKRFGSRSTISLADVRPHYGLNAVLLPLRGLVPAYESPWALHQRTRPSPHDVGYKPSWGTDGCIISNTYLLCSNWFRRSTRSTSQCCDLFPAISHHWKQSVILYLATFSDRRGMKCAMREILDELMSC
ncbi:hypothetical protein EDB89DRAFT_315366 [Lactarius sanguifluus]|nr:hypothetical protein EDB89DRAFT_315366 [Lactarius sanguifluus]